MLLLTEDAVLKCAHGGTVKLDPIQHWVTINKRVILVEGDPLRRSISACPNATPVTPPCRTTVSVDEQASYSSLVRIDGLPICKDTATGATDWSQLGAIPFSVSESRANPSDGWSLTVAISGWLFGLDHMGEIGVARDTGPTLKPSGGIAMIEGDAAVRQAIMILLSTSPGERVMRPDYGCSLNRLVFEPNDATTAGLAIHYVRQALIRWEPRIEILRIDARSGLNGDQSGDGHFLYLELDYRVRASHRMQQMKMNIDLEGGR